MPGNLADSNNQQVHPQGTDEQQNMADKTEIIAIPNQTADTSSSRLIFETIIDIHRNANTFSYVSGSK
jgi:hypothetical protein